MSTSPQGITLSEAKLQLAEWQAASKKLALGQSYTISTGTGSRTLARNAASEVRQMINYWSRIVNELQRISEGRPRRGAKVVTFNP